LNETKYDYVDFKQNFYLTCFSNKCENTLLRTNDSWRQNRSWCKIFSQSSLLQWRRQGRALGAPGPGLRLLGGGGNLLMQNKILKVV